MAFRLAPSLLLLLSLLCSLTRCEVVVSVTGGVVELEETGNDVGPEYKLKREPISLTCEATNAGDDLKLVWSTTPDQRFEASDTKKVDDESQKFTSTLTITDPTEDDLKEYNCTAKSKDGVVGYAIGTFKSPPLVNIFVGEKEVDDYTPSGDGRIQLTCEAKTSQPATFSWHRVVEGELKPVQSEFQANDSVLVLPSELKYPEHRGTLACSASNSVGNNTAKVFLRVKNPQAFLIPLVSIVVEVAIILIIVVLYEVAMRKKRAAASDSDAKTD